MPSNTKQGPATPKQGERKTMTVKSPWNKRGTVTDEMVGRIETLEKHKQRALEEIADHERAIADKREAIAEDQRLIDEYAAALAALNRTPSVGVIQTIKAMPDDQLREAIRARRDVRGIS